MIVMPDADMDQAVDALMKLTALMPGLCRSASTASLSPCTT
jgi:acyl-CoA reductase-like NAD-dependent aldehyde dehydrogenase